MCCCFYSACEFKTPNSSDPTLQILRFSQDIHFILHTTHLNNLNLPVFKCRFRGDEEQRKVKGRLAYQQFALQLE